MSEKMKMPKGVKERRDILEKQLIEKRCTLTQTFNADTKVVAKKIRNHINDEDKEIIKVGQKKVNCTFKKDNKVIENGYILVMYNNIELHSDNDTRRFVFFEIYSLGKVVSVIMSKDEFDANNKKVKGINLKGEKWSDAKFQMNLMKKYVKHKTYIVDSFKLCMMNLGNYIKSLPYNFEPSLANTTLTEEDIKNIKPIWPLIAYIIMVQINFAIKDNFSDFFLLNLISDENNDRTAKSLQILSKQFLFVTERQKQEISFIYNKETGKEINIPMIIPVGENKEEIGRILNNLQDAINNQNTGVTVIAEKFPILLSKNEIFDDRVFNFNVGRESINSLFTPSTLISLKKLKYILESNLYYIIGQPVHPIIPKLFDINRYGMYFVELICGYHIYDFTDINIVKPLKYLMDLRESFYSRLSILFSNVFSSDYTSEVQSENNEVISKIINHSIDETETRRDSIEKVVFGLSKHLIEEYDKDNIPNEKSFDKPFTINSKDGSILIGFAPEGFLNYLKKEISSDTLLFLDQEVLDIAKELNLLLIDKGKPYAKNVSSKEVFSTPDNVNGKKPCYVFSLSAMRNLIIEDSE